MKSWFASKRSSDSHLLFSGPRHSHPLGSNTNDRFNYPILPARLPKRYTRILLAVLVSLCVVHFIRSEKPWSSHRVHELELGNEIPLYPEAQDNPLDHNLPPLYEAYAEYEDFLSEQNIQNYTSQRYISFANHVHSCGWGNVMQDMVFNALLAAEANIGFVYDDYLWRNSDGSNYSEFNGKPIPARIPISTMLSGHILGHASRKTTIPLSISTRIYNKICPSSERILIRTEMLEAHLRAINSTIEPKEASGKAILDAWVSLLETPALKGARCIEVSETSEHLFNIWVLGSPRVQNLWPTLSNSPVLTNWGWSPLVHRAFERNAQFFIPEAGFNLFGSNRKWAADQWDFLTQRRPRVILPSSSRSQERAIRSFPMLPRPSIELFNKPMLSNDFLPIPVLVLHIRRGDFQEHCRNLAEWSASYTGFNSFPEFRVRDKFDVPRITGHQAKKEADAFFEVPSMDERKAIYARHCYPDIPQIVKRVRDVVHDYNKFVETKRKRKDVQRWWNFAKLSRGDDPTTRDIVTPTIVKQKLQDQNDAEILRARGSKATNGVGNAALTRLYIMTNGDRAWLEEVKGALLRDAKLSRSSTSTEWQFGWAWENASTSRDLHLGWEEKGVAQALDMYLAQRAELFVGNGFSSLTSNIVMLRKWMGFDPVQTRFW